MKIFTIIFTLIAVALIIFNATQINTDAPFEGQSMVAVITILASLCGILIVQILRISRRIETLSKKRR